MHVHASLSLTGMDNVLQHPPTCVSIVNKDGFVVDASKSLPAEVFKIIFLAKSIASVGDHSFQALRKVIEERGYCQLCN